jgi:serine/threonine-protein kinase HipA
MGTLAFRPDGPLFALELDREFVAANHDLSPLNLPLESFAGGPRVFRAGDTPFDGGLPGLIADSLPDSWGERMLKAEVPGLHTIMGKLSAVGERGPGAIAFRPFLGKGADDETVTASLSAMAQEAAKLARIPAPLTPEDVNAALAKGGGSLGGVMPKVSAHLPMGGDHLELRDLLIGGATPEGHIPCVVKLSRLDDDGGGTVEFAYHIMARNAGIRVQQACLVFDGERRHFASARFDRHKQSDGTWAKRHVHTLSGMLHKRPADLHIDYEELIRLTRTLCGAVEVRECFRRVIFNLLALNRDDHGRNHSFTYDERTRTWTLSPAYDLNPAVFNVLIALSLLGRSEIPTGFAPLLRLADIGGISEREANAIYREVEQATLGGWRAAATYAGVPDGMIGYWEREMTQQTRALRASFSS